MATFTREEVRGAVRASVLKDHPDWSEDRVERFLKSWDTSDHAAQFNDDAGNEPASAQPAPPARSSTEASVLDPSKMTGDDIVAQLRTMDSSTWDGSASSRLAPQLQTRVVDSLGRSNGTVIEAPKVGELPTHEQGDQIVKAAYGVDDEQAERLRQAGNGKRLPFRG